VGNGEIEVIKISGDDNLADPMTKHVNGDGITKQMEGLSASIQNGRHDMMPRIEGSK